MTSPENSPGSLSDKVVKLHKALEEHGIPHAFGGAIALGFHKEPRATYDIDLNIFLPPELKETAIETLEDLFTISDPDRLATEISSQDQGKIYWGETRIDLFFADTDFHKSMAERAYKVNYGGDEITITSAEDLIVCKALLNRPKDWLDIDGVVSAQGPNLDVAYVIHWLEYFLGDNDPTFSRLKTAVDIAQEPN